MTDVEIRMLQAADTEAFRTIRLKALQDAPHAFGGKYEDEKNKPFSYWQDLVRQPPDKSVSYIAVQGGNPVGLIFGFLRQDESEHAGIGGMWVDPAFRQKGLAHRLMERVLAWASGNGLKKISLWNVEDNLFAEKLYSGLGFYATGRRKPLDSFPELSVRELAKIL